MWEKATLRRSRNSSGKLSSGGGTRDLSDLFQQPRSRKLPVTLHRCYGNAEGFRGLILGEAPEISEFHHLRGAGVHPGKAIERVVQVQYALIDRHANFRHSFQ